jgi:hypothetical protein
LARKLLKEKEKMELKLHSDSFDLFASFLGLKSKKKIGRNGVPYQTQMDDDERGHVKSDPKNDPETASNSPEVQFDVMQEPQNNELHWSYPESSSSQTQLSHHQKAEDNVYSFCHERRGIAVLVINSKFDNQSERENALWDIYYMRKMFSEIGFDVKILHNRASSDLLIELKGR